MSSGRRWKLSCGWSGRKPASPLASETGAVETGERAAAAGSRWTGSRWSSRGSLASGWPGLAGAGHGKMGKPGWRQHDTRLPVACAEARIGKGVTGPVLLYIPAAVELGFAHTAILHGLP